MDFPMLGMIQLFGFGYGPAPDGTWIPCDGRTLAVNTFQALFSLIGFKFGGNGSTTFAVPDLRQAVPIKKTPLMGYYISTNGFYPSQN